MNGEAGSRVPAVIVGAGVNGLGVLRSLAAAHVPCIVVDTSAALPAMRSRFGRKHVYRDDGADAVIRALEQIAADMRGERPALVLTQEHAVTHVSRQRERLQDLYRFTLPAHDVLTALMHKEGFYKLALAAGASIPRSCHITTTAQIDALAALQPPLVVKPGVRDRAYAARFRKAYRVESVGEAQTLVQRILPILADVVVQEWIEGADSDIYFCLQYVAAEGETAASFVGRKIRSWPPQVGGTACCAPAPDAKVLSARTTAFFAHVGMRGFASMEYKRDVRSGEFFMVEPTIGRTDHQEEVATLNGVNIPLAAYRAELGLAVAPVSSSKKPVCVWRDRAADQRSAARSTSVAPWQPPQARIVDSLWRVADPMPAVVPFVSRLKRRAHRIMRAGRNTASSSKTKS